MSPTPVNPDKGKYKIPGKDKKDLELTIDDDPDKYIVEDMEDDMTDKIPASASQTIRWFACFAIYNKSNGQKHGYAKVKYSFKVNMDGIEKLYVGLGGKAGSAIDVTDEMKQNGKVDLNDGDPPIGRYP
jgi:hypothetical protein